MFVIPRLDRGIQWFQLPLDCLAPGESPRRPVKSDADLREESLQPDNDKIGRYGEGYL
jgi:hypothetical protein